MTTYEIKIKFSVTQNWIDDGFDDGVLEYALKAFLEEEILPYAYAGIETKVKDLKIKECPAKP